MKIYIISAILCLTNMLVFGDSTQQETLYTEFQERAFYKDNPVYRIIDLGTLQTDRSEAIAINEKGQVLGTFEEGLATYIFLWDPNKGLKVLDRSFDPCKESVDYLKLNNKGDVVGIIYQSGKNEIQFLRWYTEYNFLEISTPPFDGLSHLMFNDKGHVVFNRQYFYDKTKTVDLRDLFVKTFSGNYVYHGVQSLDNFGNVVVVVYEKYYDQLGKLFYKYKSFFWNGFNFTDLTPSDFIFAVNRDDKGNLIIYKTDENGNHQGYFIPKENGETIKLIPYYGNGEFTLKGNSLVRIGSLLGELKYDKNGSAYYGPGIYVKKLLVEEPPFYNVQNNRTKIKDQNSKGWVVGTIDTLYPGHHAFLAIPEVKNK